MAQRYKAFRQPTFARRRTPGKVSGSRAVAMARLRAAPMRATRPGPAIPRSRYTGQELKFLDTSLNASALTAPTDAAGGEHNQSATVGPSTIGQGDTGSSRDGRKCEIRSVFLNGVITCIPQLDVTSLDHQPTVFVALVMDMQTNGAQLDSEDVYKNTGAAAFLAASPVRNLLMSSRFKVLDSTQFELAQPQVAADGAASNLWEQMGTTRPFKLSWKGAMSQTYSAASQSIVNVTDNSIHVIAYTNNITLVPRLSYNCRTRFVG